MGAEGDASATLPNRISGPDCSVAQSGNIDSFAGGVVSASDSHDHYYSQRGIMPRVSVKSLSGEGFPPRIHVNS